MTVYKCPHCRSDNLREVNYFSSYYTIVDWGEDGIPCEGELDLGIYSDTGFCGLYCMNCKKEFEYELVIKEELDEIK
jgi:DNA-directed RNA polymerase subunit RPC12/RpoP